MIAALDVVAGEYAGDIQPYAGELDEKKLREALEALQSRFPLYLVSYGSGTNTRETQISPEPGAPWIVRHDCNFVVICADNDARGEAEQRRGPVGVYKMIDDAHVALEGRHLFALLGEEPDAERVLLNPGEFLATDVEHIAHFADVTAYAVPFSTYFRYLTPDRRDPLTEIGDVEFEINLLNSPRVGRGNAPGVIVR